MSSGTITVSWGKYGGFYVTSHRVCLGWVAFTLIPNVEIEELMAAWTILDCEGRDVCPEGYAPLAAAHRVWASRSPEGEAACRG